MSAKAIQEAKKKRKVFFFLKKTIILKLQEKKETHSDKYYERIFTLDTSIFPSLCDLQCLKISNKNINVI